MKFVLNATLRTVRLAQGAWKITFEVPASDGVEMAKVCCACQEEPLKVTIETEAQETIGGAQ